MKIYLAARYSRREELYEYHKDLIKLGHEVTSSWLVDTSENTAIVEGSIHTMPLESRPYAARDYNEIARSNIVISFTESPISRYGRGGRHVEFGLAMAWGKQLIIVGPRENIFHTLGDVEQFDTWQDCLEFIAKIA